MKKAVTVVFDDEQYEQVRAEAEADHRSVSNFVVHRLMFFLAGGVLPPARGAGVAEAAGEYPERKRGAA